MAVGGMAPKIMILLSVLDNTVYAGLFPGMFIVVICDEQVLTLGF